jgi:hypothetical protein
MGVGVSLVLRSMLDLAWIDLIPVNNKIQNFVAYFIKKIRTSAHQCFLGLFSRLFLISLEFGKYFTVIQIVPVPVRVCHGKTTLAPDV